MADLAIDPDLALNPPLVHGGMTYCGRQREDQRHHGEQAAEAVVLCHQLSEPDDGDAVRVSALSGD